MSEKIYHYTRLDTAIRFILPRMELKTSSLDKMNDPRENQLWSFFTVNVELKNIYSTYTEESHFAHIYKFGNEVKKQVQLICFVHSDTSPGFENEMMWAHYAENHQGICLEIDKKKFLQENEDTGIYKLDNVIYGDSKKPSARWDRRRTHQENLMEFVKNQHQRLFLSKSRFWERESEIRLLKLDTESCYFNIKKSLTGLYCGLFFDDNYKASLENLIDGRQTRIYDLMYQQGKIGRVKRKIGDRRPFVLKYYLKEIERDSVK